MIRPPVLALLASILIGCGGGSGGGGSLVGSPISVSLGLPTVVVSADGTPAFVQITIRSASETALVSFVGLPAGVQANYQASDTNPSGLLTFTATGKTSAGTYMPIVTVISAGQTATLQFTMIVPAK